MRPLRSLSLGSYLKIQEMAWIVLKKEEPYFLILNSTRRTWLVQIARLIARKASAS
jgi:hypothetical protein